MEDPLILVLVHPFGLVREPQAFFVVVMHVRHRYTSWSMRVFVRYHESMSGIRVSVQETAWAAGLFEGEGSIYVRRIPPAYVQLTIVSTDRDVLARFAEIAGAGLVRLAVPATADHKAQYRWHTARRADAARILGELRPWFGERRGARADEALAWLAERS